MNFISYKYNIDTNDVMNDVQSFMKEESSNMMKSNIEDDFKNFLDREEEKLEASFNSKYNFQKS